jgi:hypothetical protein
VACFSTAMPLVLAFLFSTAGKTKAIKHNGLKMSLNSSRSRKDHNILRFSQIFGKNLAFF